MINQVHVLSPRTWGEFGNYLAATRLTGVLRDQLDAEVTLQEAEPILPWLGTIGADIRDITLTSPDAATRTRRYLARMSQLERRYPPDFEADPRAGGRPELAGLVNHLRQTQPDVVVGTKGFLARLCRAASHALLRPPRVVSHITNPGLLRLGIHRSRHLDLTLLPFDWARRQLPAPQGTPPGRLRVVGPLIAQHELGEFLAGGQPGTGADKVAAEARPDAGWGPVEAGNRPRVIVFSNRGGNAYPRIVRHLARCHPHIDLVFVGYNDPDLAREAAAAGSGMARWRFHSRLPQADFFAYLAQASCSPHGLLISKSGPNTTFEAAYHAIPVLMLESGLPMEGWVADLIHDHRLGRCCGTADQLIRVLDNWLADPAALREHKRAAAGFARDVLDQTAVAARIGAAVRELAVPEVAR